MKVLVADDEQVARMIAERKIQSFGYEVVTVEDGAQALDILLGADPPRIAVLDWLMPGFDGVTICKRLHERVDAPLIYTILLTSRTEQVHLVEALESGAHDFQRKPFDPDELRCRLKIACRLIAAEDKVRHYAADLEVLAEVRARQLLHADRLASLGVLTAGIIHEINNPLGFISANAQIQERMLPELLGAITHAMEQGVGNRTKLAFSLEELPASIAGIRTGVKRLGGIIQSMKRFGRDAEETATPFDIHACLESALTLCHNSLKYDVEVVKAYAENLPRLSGYPQRIEQVFVNLLLNAVDAMEPMGGGQIAITTTRADQAVRITIHDSGPGIPADLRARILDPFVTTKPAGKGTGLGLSISTGIINEHQGTLCLDPDAKGGACFVICLPVSEEG